MLQILVACDPIIIDELSNFADELSTFAALSPCDGVRPKILCVRSRAFAQSAADGKFTDRNSRSSRSDSSDASAIPPCRKNE